MFRPLAIDLFCGLGGWSEGLLADGYEVVGFDVERHRYPDGRGYPAQLVLQDVLTMDGRQFRDAALIVASPPCQEFSYMAMPWRRAKQIARALRGEDKFPEGYTGSTTTTELTALFDACFRIQREASEAAGRQIPMVVENVRGAIPWVGRSRANFGSYHLWGDVAMVGNRIIADLGTPQFGQTALAAPGKAAQEFNHDGTAHPQGSWFAVADSKNRGSKQPGRNFHFPEKYGIPSPSFHGAEHEPSVRDAMALKNSGSNTWFGIQSNGDRYPGQPGNPVRNAGAKFGGGWWNYSTNNLIRKASSRSQARKHASALIAKIPLPLARHIARIYKGYSQGVSL